MTADLSNADGMVLLKGKGDLPQDSNILEMTASEAVPEICLEQVTGGRDMEAKSHERSLVELHSGYWKNFNNES